MSHSKPGVIGKLLAALSFRRARPTPMLDWTGPVTIYVTRTGAHRAVGVAAMVYPPEPSLLTLAGEFRAGPWR